MPPANPYTVDVDWLREKLEADNLKIIEAPWREDRYHRAHIQGALCLPCHSYLKAEDAQGNRLPHVFDADTFRDILDSIGIQKTDTIVFYDDYHGLFAARCWWVFHYYGFDQIKILDGGWHAWFEKKYPLSMIADEITPGTNFVPTVRGDRNIHIQDLISDVEAGRVKIWDTRRPEEYNGTEETSNRRCGHIPGAINLEWTTLLEPEQYPTGPRYLKSLKEMERILTEAGLHRTDTIITHCQASIRGAFGSLVLDMLQYPKHRLYDAAMAEWANHDHTPLAS